MRVEINKCILKLENEVRGECMVVASFLTVEWGFIVKQGEEVGVIHVVTDQSWRHQYEHMFN